MTPSVGNARRAHRDFGQRSLPGRRMTAPFPLCPSVEFVDTCPASILDTEPSGGCQGCGYCWVVRADGRDEVRAPSARARRQMSSAWKATMTAIMIRISPKPPSSLMWAK
jgi:hypothetical protein